MLRYSATVGKAIKGQELDVAELRRLAGGVASTGARMRADAPADIRAQFATVLSGVAISAAALDKQDATVVDLVDPIYREASRPAFDEVSKYNCG
ncbi:hypothetical protein [Amycolatopsis sp. NPDC051371]|uniref:hypothetical protein n=1 Tax=Amycolatopsis sp. NPDC051371 TaxID=3155800 RepID=UPI00342F6B4E